jgi:septal ring factor EnvC (AmiA/AmiB activator)
MGNRDLNTPAPRRRLTAKLASCAVALCACAGLVIGAGPSFAAQSIDELNSQIAGARQQAQDLGAQIDATSAELASAQQQAIVAAQREAQLSAVLAAGEERERKLEGEVTVAKGQLDVARTHLQHSLNTLSNRLVDIYRGGMPDATTLLLEADGMDDLQTRAEYLRRIEEADSSLVSSVRSLRDQVANRLAAVEDAQRRAHEFNQQIAAARDQISAVRAQAEARAQQLQALRAERQAAIDSLQSQVSGWTSQVQHLERVSARQAAGEVDKWFGDWAIPESIVQCESGGNFGAVNPSSGAGGAYQILPSTWELYGGHGDPQDAPPQQQSDVAAQIWADSGSAAWECAQ